MRWVKTDLGWVNLAYVAKIAHIPKSREYQYRYGLFGADNGTSMGIVQDHQPVFWADLLAPIVPAAPGAFVYSVSYVNDDGKRPTQADEWIDQYSVVAWRLEQSLGPQPILAITGYDDDYPGVLIPRPDGRLEQPHVALHANLDEAKASILADTQRAWDSKQTEKVRRCRPPEITTDG
jgi:hypothetical protein